MASTVSTLKCEVCDHCRQQYGWLLQPLKLPSRAGLLPTCDVCLLAWTPRDHMLLQLSIPCLHAGYFGP